MRGLQPPVGPPPYRHHVPPRPDGDPAGRQTVGEEDLGSLRLHRHRLGVPRRRHREALQGKGGLIQVLFSFSGSLLVFLLLAGESGDPAAGLGPDGPVRPGASRSLHRQLRLLLLRLREEREGRPRAAVLLLRLG